MIIPYQLRKMIEAVIASRPVAAVGSPIGANISHSNLALIDGVYTNVPLNPESPSIHQSWVNGLTFNGTDDGLVVGTKGRYLLSCIVSFLEDAALDLHWVIACSLGHSNGAQQRVAANAATLQISFNFVDTAELDVGEEIVFGVEVDGGNATAALILSTVQYLGPATSI